MRFEEKATLVALLSALVGAWFAVLTTLVRWVS